MFAAESAPLITNNGDEVYVFVVKPKPQPVVYPTKPQCQSEHVSGRCFGFSCLFLFKAIFAICAVAFPWYHLINFDL